MGETLFQPSGGRYWKTNTVCYSEGPNLMYLYGKDGAAPLGLTDGRIVDTIWFNCRRKGERLWVEGDAGGYKGVFRWGANLQSTSVFYGGLPQLPPASPSSWRALTYAPITTVGSFTTVTVPLTSLQTRVYRYDAATTAPWCAAVSVQPDIRGDQPIVIDIVGLAPCNYAFVVSVVASLP